MPDIFIFVCGQDSQSKHKNLGVNAVTESPTLKPSSIAPSSRYPTNKPSSQNPTTKPSSALPSASPTMVFIKMLLYLYTIYLLFVVEKIPPLDS